MHKDEFCIYALCQKTMEKTAWGCTGKGQKKVNHFKINIEPQKITQGRFSFRTRYTSLANRELPTAHEGGLC